MTCQECGKHLTGQQTLYCSARCKSRVWRLHHPERNLELARASQERNREARRAYDREYNRRPEVRGTCEVCGGLMGVDKRFANGICRPCRSAAVASRSHQIERWWAEGLKQPEIAKRLGWSMNHMRVEMVRMRRAGYDLPYRYPTRNGKRIPGPRIAA